jgi:cholesterol oxidase
MNGITRRQFIQGVGASAAVAAFGTLPAWARRSEYIPALVIGSGFAGAVTALRLAQARIRTVVLERGKRWTIRPDGDTFATFEQPDGRSAWLATKTTDLQGLPIDVYTGVLELITAPDPATFPKPTIVSPQMDIRNGAGVGGGSLVYNSILLQPHRELFERVFPPQIKYDEMAEVYYPRARSILQPEPVPEDILATPEYLNYQVVEEQIDAAGFDKRPMPAGIDWDIVREEFAGTKRPSAIAGQSWFGLNSGAQKSVDKNYLYRAEASGYVEVLPLHMVVEIHEVRAFGLYRVVADEINTSGETLRRREFTCSRLFLAAGSPNTTALLVKARETGTMPRLSKGIGKSWGTNGEFILVWNDLSRPTNPGQGGPTAHVVAEDPRDPATSYASLVVPPPIKDFFAGSSFAVGMGLAPPLGEFRYDAASERVVVDWPAADARLTPWVESTIRMRDTLFAANNFDPNPLANFFSRALTGHPVGGAVIGLACDPYGRVHGHYGLYVVDGAFIPGSTGVVNPALTITALAERNVEHIIRRDFTDRRLITEPAVF